MDVLSEEDVVQHMWCQLPSVERNTLGAKAECKGCSTPSVKSCIHFCFQALEPEEAVWVHTVPSKVTEKLIKAIYSMRMSSSFGCVSFCFQFDTFGLFAWVFTLF